MDQNRKSRMEPAEGSRETVLDNERMGSGSDEVSGGSDEMSRERMRNRDSSSEDLGSSSDRAMMTGRGSEGRSVSPEDESFGSSGTMSERGQGSSGERNLGSSGGSSSGSSRSSNTGGITNRDLEREQSEQDQLPERGRSQSER